MKLQSFAFILFLLPATIFAMSNDPVDLIRTTTERVLAELEKAYDLRAGGNYREEATGEPTGTNILFMRPDGSESSELPESVRLKLFQQRAERVRPLKDDKILTSWNGLMIAALARAGGVLGEPSYLEAAENAQTFIWEQLRTPEGRPLR